MTQASTWPGYSTRDRSLMVCIGSHGLRSRQIQDCLDTLGSRDKSAAIIATPQQVVPLPLIGSVTTVYLRSRFLDSWPGLIVSLSINRPC
jgi:hypothetical protein